MDPNQALDFISEVVKTAQLPVTIGNAQAYLMQIQAAFNTLGAAIATPSVSVDKESVRLKITVPTQPRQSPLTPKAK